MFYTGFKPGTTKTISLRSSDLPLDHGAEHGKQWWLYNVYDLDCVDDQHSHGKSVGKYHMVNRVKEN